MNDDREVLPIDSDIEVAQTSSRPRPLHLRPALLGLVALGGAVGTGVRAELTLAVPDLDGFPVAILVANVIGAFVLGLLLDFLARRGPDERLRQKLRLLLGTGFCGGFTTYSSLASACALYLTSSAPWMALLYGLGSIVLGLLASALGIAAGTRLHRRTIR